MASGLSLCLGCVAQAVCTRYLAGAGVHYRALAIYER